MRVKITYTVEIEKVEEEVKEILARSLNKLEDSLSQVMEVHNSLATKRMHLDSTLSELNKVRANLFKADSTIADCHDILKGYSSVLKKIEEEVQNEEP